MTSTQFMRIQPFNSTSQLHSSPHLQRQQHRSPSMRKFSFSSATCSLSSSSIDMLANAEALSNTSPTSGHVSPESDDTEIIVNGNPVSPQSTIPLSYCSEIDVEPDGGDFFGKKGLPRTHSYDHNLFDIRRVPPEQIAAQITLLDLKKFKAIDVKELRGGNWNKKGKRELAPNIVAFTQQFNHMAFLVVREILSEENEKARAEKMTQFIKIAKKLNDLNNLHSLKAVIGALQSTPIHRLSLTWRHVSKRDKATFEKLEELLSDDSNWKLLRERMDAHVLPGIPHLGLYLTDLCFLENLPTKNKRDGIINVICYYQNSTYDMFEDIPHIRKYLTRVRYIEELQKFYEDDNYKLSLKLEPRDFPPGAAIGTVVGPVGAVGAVAGAVMDLTRPVISTTDTVMGPTSSGRDTTGAGVGPTDAVMDTTGAGVNPISAAVGTAGVGTNPIGPVVGTTGVSVCTSSAGVSTTGAGIDAGVNTTSAGIGTTSAIIGTTSAGIGTTSAGIGTTSAGIGTTSAGIGTTSAAIGTTSAGIGTTSTNFGITGSSIGTTRAGLDTTNAATVDARVGSAVAAGLVSLALTSKLPSVSSLRSSKSYEELSTEEEGDDVESPFVGSKRSSFGRRSLNTNSKGNTSLSASKLKGVGQPWSFLKQKTSVPNLKQQQSGREEKFSSSMDMKKLSSIGSSPSSSPFTRSTATALPSSSPYPFLKPRSSSDWAAEELKTRDMKPDSRISSLSALEHPSPATPSSSSSNSSQNQHPQLPPSSSSPSSTHSIPQKYNQIPPPSPSPLLAGRKRGHNKSQSLGSNVLSKLGVTKPSPVELPKRLSPEPAPFVSLIDDSLISSSFPVTPTGSIGNASTISGGSSRGSTEDLAEEGLLWTEEDEEVVSQHNRELIKEGILRKKDVRLKGQTVSQFKGRSKCYMQLGPDKIAFTDVKGKKLSKQVTTVLLRSCQLKHRDPRENLNEKQFLLNDDDGNSTRFTAKSVKGAMEWVVAIKEAIRVQEEKEREEAERSLIKL